MILSCLPISAFAEAQDGTCEHHHEHTAECGYVAAVEGQPCTHECGEECAEACVHEHDDTCGYVAVVEGSPCKYECNESHDEQESTESMKTSEPAYTAEDGKTMIDALPDVSELEDMDNDELSKVHDKAQEAVNADDAGYDPNYYNKDSNKIASVTVVWTAMSFSYNKGTWDTDTMTWEGGGWEADVGCGTVTVTNTGNLDVIAQFGVNFTDNTLGISVSFTENGTVLTDNKLTIAKGAEKTVSVKLTGDEPSKYIETAKTIGQITITLSTE